MHITAENRDTGRVLSGNALHSLNQIASLGFVLPGSIMVIQIIKKIHGTIKLVEEAATHAKSTVEQLDRTDERAAENVLKPGETLLIVSFIPLMKSLLTYRISNWDAKEQNQMLDGLACSDCSAELAS